MPFLPAWHALSSWFYVGDTERETETQRERESDLAWLLFGSTVAVEVLGPILDGPVTGFSL